MEFSLYKMHGSKNTFYLMDTQSLDSIPYIELTKWLCEPSNNEGADGLLLVLPSNVANAKMRVINADGSEASMCGNGLRCVARYLCEREGIDEARIETMKAVLHVAKEQEMLPNIETYSVQISPVSFDLMTLPMSYEGKTEIQNERLPIFSDSILYSAVSVPNPHLIGIVDKYYIQDPTHQKLLAKKLNGINEYTPDGVNLSYVYPISKNEIFVRTFERGVGFTNACGTAMTASALVAFKNNIVTEPQVTVYNPGGFVQCLIKSTNEEYDLRLIGNATYVQHLIVKYEDHNFSITSCEPNQDAITYEITIRKQLDKIQSYFSQ